jgi:hypothetical protein
VNLTTQVILVPRLRVSTALTLSSLLPSWRKVTTLHLPLPSYVHMPHAGFSPGMVTNHILRTTSSTSTVTDDLGYDVRLCDTSAIALYVLWYQPILRKASVFFALLSTTYIIASTSDITTLPVISTNIILQEAYYFVNSTISSS